MQQTSLEIYTVQYGTVRYLFFSQIRIVIGQVLKEGWTFVRPLTNESLFIKIRYHCDFLSKDGTQIFKNNFISLPGETYEDEHHHKMATNYYGRSIYRRERYGTVQM